MHTLETHYDVRGNITAIMSAQQCMLAAMAGATSISLFGGRVNNMGYDSREEVSRTRNLIGCVRKLDEVDRRFHVGALNIVEWFEAGSDVVGAVPGLKEVTLLHPYSRKTVKMFQEDGKQYPRRAKP